MSMYNMTNVYITTQLDTFYLIIPHFVGVRISQVALNDVNGADGLEINMVHVRTLVNLASPHGMKK